MDLVAEVSPRGPDPGLKGLICAKPPLPTAQGGRRSMKPPSEGGWPHSELMAARVLPIPNPLPAHSGMKRREQWQRY